MKRIMGNREWGIERVHAAPGLSQGSVAFPIPDSPFPIPGSEGAPV
jgi:hypothetical protein